MWHILMTAVNAVVPIILLIGLGYFLRQRGVLSDLFVKNGGALVFKVLLPVLLFVNIYDMGDLSDVDWAAVLFCVGAVVALFLLGIPVALLGTRDPLRRGVLWQCVFRSNYNIIGLPLAAALGGEEALTFASIVAALVVPLYNVFAVISLCVFVRPEDGKKPSVKKICLFFNLNNKIFHRLYLISAYNKLTGNSNRNHSAKYNGNTCKKTQTDNSL